uniref:Uncharacterized protein n=1 Tax=Amphimedon queenslandica TaxID=400682 RepID=A0A1X7V7P7_AMPQE
MGMGYMEFLHHWRGVWAKWTWHHPYIRIPTPARTTQSSVRPGRSAGNRYEPQNGYKQTKH